MTDADASGSRRRIAAVQALLQPGETVVWTGASKGTPSLSRRQGAAIAFNLVWWATLLFVGWSMRAFAGSPLLIALGVFVGIGAMQDSWRTGRWLLGRFGEHYALTDRRVLVLDRKGGLKAEVGLEAVDRFRAVPATGARGTILLGEDAPLFVPAGRPLRVNPDEDAPRLSDVRGHLALLERIRTAAAGQPCDERATNPRRPA